MNIALLTNLDLASNYALNLLVPQLSNHQLQIFVSSQVGGSRQSVSELSIPPQLAQLKFFEQQLLTQLLFPLLEQANENSLHQTDRLKSFQQLAELTGHQLCPLNDVNQASGRQKLLAFKPDLILSIRFGKILKEGALAIPRLGVLNLHSGLLPEYQGVMATFWAMLNQESEFGTTLHFIDSAAIDAGPIVKIDKQPLDLGKSYLENVLSLYPAGCQSMLEAIVQLGQGCSLPATPQAGEASYYSFPAKNDLIRFEDKGLHLFSTDGIIQFCQLYTGRTKS